MQHRSSILKEWDQQELDELFSRFLAKEGISYADEDVVSRVLAEVNAGRLSVHNRNRAREKCRGIWKFLSSVPETRRAGCVITAGERLVQERLVDMRRTKKLYWIVVRVCETDGEIKVVGEGCNAEVL
eukprot:CAMPEP_0181297118 /NCGR_PEP_ID=MMETSP1101-20121128/5066_1 /TAXON_ID=46948 /ORGANISM="Rhodomonas abbreviata, Strain Caron Lab Isolate" /LENGTH=127 /DNA_ID=CAMNT_0023402027 /DNA_START=666 /DNA_END=1046 /DNA_ORIENTATION=+